MRILLRLILYLAIIYLFSSYSSLNFFSVHAVAMIEVCDIVALFFMFASCFSIHIL